jgi:hypothetical protein
VSRLFEDALRVFETASQGGAADLGILIDDAGALRIVAGDGWRPDPLQTHYGAMSVFHVTHSPSGVRGRGPIRRVFLLPLERQRARYPQRSADRIAGSCITT